MTTQSPRFPGWRHMTAAQRYNARKDELFAHARQIEADRLSRGERPNENLTDITLPEGWTWDDVQAQRAKWGIASNMVPIAVAPGCVAWGTINSVRTTR